MKRILIGVLVASTLIAPTLAIAQVITPTGGPTASATGGAGGAGGVAAGGTAAGGAATNNVSGTSGASATNGGSATGGSANGGNSTVNVSVSVPGTSSTTGDSSSGLGTKGATTNSGTTPTNTSAVGDPGSSANNTKTTVDYGGTYTVKSAPSVVAPSLTTTLSDTCMGSVSFGLSFPGFGASGGSTLVDQACVRRLDAREFRAMGLNDVALALLCQSEANRKAVDAAGRIFPGADKPPPVATRNVTKTNTATGSTSTVEIGQNTDAQYTDPIIRARLGLDNVTDSIVSKDH